MPKLSSSEHESYFENYKSTGIAQIIGYGRETEGQHKDGYHFSLDLAKY
jgi:hypothetical protein